MMKSWFTKRRQVPRMLLAVLVTPGVMMTATVVSADESFLSRPNFTDLQDGDVTLAKAERGGAGIHMSLMSPSVLNGNSQSSYVFTSQSLTMPDVYLSLRLPW